MKKSLRNILIAASLVALAACSSDPDELKDYAGQVRLKGNINTLTQVSKVNENGFENNDKVGVFIAADGNMKGCDNYFDNIAFSYNSQNGTLTPSDGKIVCWPETDSKLGVFAYYPYNTNVASALEYPFAVATDQSSPANYFASDFLWAGVKNIEPQTGTIDLQFNHRLSKINITLLAGNGFETAQMVTAKKEFTIIGAATEGTIDLATGTATSGYVVKDITPLYNNELGYSAIIYPQTINIVFKITIDGETYAYSTDATFVAGYQYNFVLTINKGGELTESMNGVVEWKDNENGSAVMSNFITLSPQFKEYLLKEKLYMYDTEQDSFYTDGTMIDSDNDGNISVAEAEKVEYINFIGDKENKEMIKGLEFFCNLKYLGFRYVANTSMEISKFPKLYKLSCRDNQFTSLDVTKNPNLIVLVCIYNRLTTLDLSNNPNLKTLSCHNNLITDLDVSKNEKLVYLSCSSNKLNSLILNTKVQKLYCYENYLRTLDLTKSTELESLGCNDNRLTTLDVSKCTKMSYLRCLPMNDVAGHNMLSVIYMSKDQAIRYFYKPDATEVERK